MKKFYLLMMFALLGMVANAAEVTINFADIYGTSTISGIDKESKSKDGFTFSFTKGNSSTAPAYNKAGEIRLYGGKSSTVIDGNTMTITATSGIIITKIELLAGTVDNWGVLSSNVGEIQEDPESKNAVWSGSSSEIVLMASRDESNKDVSTQNRYKSVTITYEEVVITQVATPIFSVEGGSYIKAQTIALSCATADASIFYTINDGAETTYEAPIELNESGEYTIKAWATKEGLENSEVVTKTFTLDIFDGIIEDFDFAAIVSENGYPTDGAGTAEFKSGIVTVTSTYTGNTPNRFWSSGTQYRTYGDATLTFSVPAGYVIVKVELTPKAVDDWNGEQQSVTLEVGKQTFTDFVVYYKKVAEDQVLAPTFSLTSGTYEGTQSLTMDCATEGATIYYTVNGGEAQTYADAIELAEGEYAFVAWAEKDGMTKSSEVTANYTIVAPLVANSIAEFLTLGAENADREITLNCDLTVTYQGGGNDNTRDLYVKDAAGKGLLIFGVNSVYSNGNIIPAGLKGKLQDFNGLPELVDPSNFGEVSSGDEVSPEVFTAATITADDLSKYIVLNEVTLTELNNKNGTLTDASGDVEIRDNGYCEYPTDFSKKYDVTAVVATYWSKIQVYPTEIVEHTSSSVNDAVANEFKAVAVANGIEVNVAEAGLVSVYNAAGQLVANVNVVEGATTINVAGGFYIVKAGNNVAKVLVK